MLDGLEQRERLAEQMEEITQMTVTAWKCKQVRARRCGRARRGGCAAHGVRARSARW